MLPWALNDGEAGCDDLTKGDVSDRLVKLLTDPYITVASWGAFDYVILNEKFFKPRGLLLEPERYYDLSAHSQMLSCAAELKAACNQLGVGKDKRKDASGKRLIRLFSQPQKATKKQIAAGRPASFFITPEQRPEEWTAFKQYAVQDIIAARACHKILDTLCEWPLNERQVYIDMLRQNDHGLPIDRVLMNNAQTLLTSVHANVLARFKAVTNIDSFNKIAKIKAWCGEQGFPVESLREAALVAFLKKKDSIPEAVVRVFELRGEQPKAAINKYKKVASYLSDDGMLRGMTRYHRAGTGRFAGTGPQIQNFPKPDDSLIADLDVPEGKHDEILLARVTEIVNHVREGKLYPGVDPHTQLKSIARGIIRAPEGYQLVVMDFAGVENRYLAWVSGCELQLKVYREGGSVYTQFAL